MAVTNPVTTVPESGSREASKAKMREAREGLVREVALEAASRLFAAHGFQGTTMADVARDAGLSLTSLYNAFSGKEDLFRAVVDDGFKHQLKRALEAPPDGVDPRDTVLQLIDVLCASMEADREIVLIYARGSEGLPAELREPGRDPYEPYIRMLSERFTSLLSAVQADGGAAGPRPESIAASMIATVIRLASDRAQTSPDLSLADVAIEMRALFTPLLFNQGESAK